MYNPNTVHGASITITVIPVPSIHFLPFFHHSVSSSNHPCPQVTTPFHVFRGLLFVWFLNPQSSIFYSSNHRHRFSKHVRIIAIYFLAPFLTVSSITDRCPNSMQDNSPLTSHIHVIILTETDKYTDKHIRHSNV